MCAIRQDSIHINKYIKHNCTGVDPRHLGGMDGSIYIHMPIDPD